MGKVFTSHSSQDDGFVRDLRAALADLGRHGWIDSRELRGGDPLWPEIERAIEEASGFAVVVSTDGLQSKWVGKEVRRALELREERGKDRFPVIPLSLNGTKLGVLEELFGEEPIYIPRLECRRRGRGAARRSFRIFWPLPRCARHARLPARSGRAAVPTRPKPPHPTSVWRSSWPGRWWRASWRWRAAAARGGGCGWRWA